MPEAYALIRSSSSDNHADLWSLVVEKGGVKDSAYTHWTKRCDCVGRISFGFSAFFTPFLFEEGEQEERFVDKKTGSGGCVQVRASVSRQSRQPLGK